MHRISQERRGVRKARHHRRTGKGWPLVGSPCLVEAGDLPECLLLDIRNSAAFLRIPDDEEEEGFFFWRAIENRVEETHRARCVGQGCEPDVVEGGDEKSDRDADRFFGVVGFRRIFVVSEDMGFLKNGDQGGSGLEKGFFGGSSELTDRNLLIQGFLSGRRSCRV